MNKNSYIKTLLAASLLGMMGAAQAEVTASANVSLTSDYRFRGVSQNIDAAGTGAEPALQGGFDIDFGNGFILPWVVVIQQPNIITNGAQVCGKTTVKIHL